MTRPVPGFSCDIVAQRDLVGEIRGFVGQRPCGFSAGILAADHAVGGELRALADDIDLKIFYHAVDLDLGGVDPLDRSHLRRVGAMAELLGSAHIATDGAMWVKDGEYLLEAMVPMALLDDTALYIADRIKLIQDIVQLPVAIENPPFFYLVGGRHVLSVMSEIAEEADCLLTLDSGHLWGYAHIAKCSLFPDDIDIPWDRVAEVHISGTRVASEAGEDSFVDDQHSWQPEEEVWSVLRSFLERADNLRFAMSEAEGMTAKSIGRNVQRIESMICSASEANEAA